MTMEQYRLNSKKVFSNNPMIYIDPVEVRRSILSPGVMGRKGTAKRKRFYSDLIRYGKVMGGTWDKDERTRDISGWRLPEYMLGKNPEKYNPIIESIRKEGYKTQKEMGTGALWDEVSVAIGGDGTLFHTDGIHRLLIARKLGLEKIPVCVILTHRSYQE